MQGVLVDRLTWTESAEAFKRYDLAVIPLGGATKEHGYHLPNNTDYLLAEGLRERVAERVPALVMPTLPYAYYPAFIDFPGSVSIQPHHFAGTMADIIRCLERHGIRRFLIINAGLSTLAPLEVMAKELFDTLGVLVGVLVIENLGYEAYQEVREEVAGTHAGEFETSVLLSLHPEVVHMDLAVRDMFDRPAACITVDGKPKVRIPRRMTTKSGVYGDATLASAEKGHKIVKAMVDDIAAIAKHLRTLRLPDR